MIGEPVLHRAERPDSEHHVAVELGFAGDQITDHVGAHHLLVHRVGLDVFEVERSAIFMRTKAFECLRHPAGPRRRRHLGGGEMTDGRAAKSSMQPEQRHQVHHGQRLGGDVR